MNKEIEAALNDQVNAEFHSSYLYLSMANYFAAENLEGMAGWMQAQAEEERAHAMKFLDFINDRGGRVLLQQLDAPRVQWSTAEEVFRDSYEHECLISSKINKLVDMAVTHSDHAAIAFLQWFVTEQVEEEATALSIVEKLKKIGGNPMGLFMIDEQLSQRNSAATPE